MLIAYYRKARAPIPGISAYAISRAFPLVVSQIKVTLASRSRSGISIEIPNIGQYDIRPLDRLSASMTYNGGSVYLLTAGVTGVSVSAAPSGTTGSVDAASTRDFTGYFAHLDAGAASVSGGGSAPPPFVPLYRPGIFTPANVRSVSISGETSITCDMEPMTPGRLVVYGASRFYATQVAFHESANSRYMIVSG